MKYSEARGKIRTGDVIAWTHKPWGSWYDLQIQAVRMFTQSEYSHVGLALVLAGRVFVLEAVSSGIRMVPLSLDLPCFWMPTVANIDDEVLTIALNKLGARYSKLEAIKAFFTKLKPGANDAWECAEYVSFVLLHAGVPVDCKSTPSALVSWLQDEYGTILIPLHKD